MKTIETRPRLHRSLLAGLCASALLLGCGNDPLGPENRFALVAFGQCSYDQALMLAEQAIASDNPDHVERGLLLKAAILQDRGDTAAAEALYPEIAAAWERARDKPLKPSRREREIQLLLDIARAERRAKELDPDCENVPQKGPRPEPDA
ncbi:MAG: hypothetical protein GVY22_09620 [Gammaproteobacteria bacterium]|jgi:tetratricopeptide (TPR) repeat protein|nr:hypothetical protein [Gammaproteobacteria bacterium]